MTATQTDTLFARVRVRGQRYDLTYLLDVPRSWRGEENQGAGLAVFGAAGFGG